MSVGRHANSTYPSDGNSRATYLAVDELEVTRALAVAITSPVLGTGLIRRVLGHATVGSHGHKVQSTVETALDQILAYTSS